MESQASVQHFSSGLERIERSSLRGVLSGEIRLDAQTCKERVAVRCLTCLHQIWAKTTEGQLRLAFRKSDRGVLMGYIVSPTVPKGKQSVQADCVPKLHQQLGWRAR